MKRTDPAHNRMPIVVTRREMLRSLGQQALECWACRSAGGRRRLRISP